MRYWIATVVLMAGCLAPNPDYQPAEELDNGDGGSGAITHPWNGGDLSYRISTHDLGLLPGCGGKDQLCCAPDVDHPKPWCNQNGYVCSDTWFRNDVFLGMTCLNTRY